jgi:hypothetical protein
MTTDQTNNAIKAAIFRQAEELKQRAVWFEKNIENRQRVIENAQASEEHFRVQLQAVHTALDALREEHKILTKKGNAE